MVNPVDMVKALINHPKMRHLRAEAGTAYVERETGAVAGIMRAVQAATDPTEGQRILQSGYDGAIAGGESRENVSTTIGADGRTTIERLVERSAVLPDGTGVNVQQAQQAVHSPPLSVDSLGHHMMNMSGHISTMATSVEKLSDFVKSKTSELETKNAELEAKNAELEAKTNAIDERVAVIENKRRRVAATAAEYRKKNWRRSEHPELPMNIEGRAGLFGWKRIVNGKHSSKQGFTSIELAHRDMCMFYGEQYPGPYTPSVMDMWRASNSSI